MSINLNGASNPKPHQLQSQLAKLMFEHVYKLHGLPWNIISDRDVLFTSTFWKQLHRLIGIKLRLSSAYHPQLDGSTERANRTITQMLRQCVNLNQKDWVTKLPAIEFAINSARSESTGFAPFFLNFGRMPRSMLWTHNPSTEFPAVRTFALQKKLAIMAAHDSILAARVKQTRDANRKRRDAPFKTGELVYLSSKNISFAKGLARKLIPKFIGPYKVLQDFGNASFRLDLPPHLKRRGVHDVFHSSLLREHIPNDDRLFPGRMDTQVGNTPETEGEWVVERILSHAGARKDSVFEIKWKSGDISWLPYYQITHLQALTDYLDLFGESKINNLPKGTGKPPQDDPQIFLGYVSLSFPFTTISTNSHSSDIKTPLEINAQNSPTLFSTISPVQQPSIATIMNPRRSLPCVNHPLFTRISPTFYLIRDPEYPSILRSTWARLRSILSSTTKYAPVMGAPPFDQYLSVTPSSVPLGTLTPPTTTHVASAPFSWVPIPKTTRPTLPHTLSNSMSSSSLQNRPVSQ